MGWLKVKSLKSCIIACVIFVAPESQGKVGNEVSFIYCVPLLFCCVPNQFTSSLEPEPEQNIVYQPFRDFPCLVYKFNCSSKQQRLPKRVHTYIYYIHTYVLTIYLYTKRIHIYIYNIYISYMNNLCMVHCAYI